jgi:PAS domain S-box-containing protein
MDILDWGSDLRARLRLEQASGGLADASLSVLLENVPVTLAVLYGADHRFVFANRAYRTAVGRSDSIVGLTLAEALGTDAARIWAPVLDGVRQTDTPWHQDEVRDPFSGRLWTVHLLPLKDDAGAVLGVLSLGLDVTAEVEANRRAEAARVEGLRHLERLNLAVEATDLGMWEWDVETGAVFWSGRQRALFGLSEDAVASYEVWCEALHPEDRERVLAAVTALLDPASDGRLALEHRIVRPDGSVIWIASRGRMIYGDREGRRGPVRLLGTIRDVTARKASEDARRMLLREMDHRIKNLFAVANGIVAVSARTATGVRELADTIRGRLQALATSHALVRPLLDDTASDQRAPLRDLVETVLRPFADRPDQIALDGPEVRLPMATASTLALVLHELGTNASKYGGLRDGTVRVAWRLDGHRLHLTWTEACAEARPESASRGFGSVLLERSVRDTLRGEIATTWDPAGIEVVLAIPVGP